MVLVSALNVGVMQVSFEDRIQKNANEKESQSYDFKDLYLNKGDDFGCFEMGSTIVILAEKDTLDLKIQTGNNVQYGQTIAKIN